MQLARAISLSQLISLNARSPSVETHNSSPALGGQQSEQGQLAAQEQEAALGVKGEDALAKSKAHEQLLLAAGQGDQAAFAELVEAYQQPLYGFVVNMLGHVSGADDVTQEVFLRLWKAAPRWKPKASVRSFLYLIARRVVYNEFRRRKRKPVQSLEQLEQEHPQHAAQIEAIDSQPLADEQLSKSEFWQAVDQALAELPSKQRAVLLLRRDGDLSYEEISQSLGMSVSSVKSQLWRARKQMREQLERFLQDAFPRCF